MMEVTPYGYIDSVLRSQSISIEILLRLQAMPF